METVETRDINAPRPRNNRSKVSNGTRLFVEPLDGRTSAGRRFKDLVADFAGDLGGRDRLSEGQKQLIRRASLISTICEKAEAEAVQERPFDVAEYAVLTNALGRVLKLLGVERKAKPVQDFRTYMEAKAKHD